MVFGMSLFVLVILCISSGFAIYLTMVVLKTKGGGIEAEKNASQPTAPANTAGTEMVSATGSVANGTQSGRLVSIADTKVSSSVKPQTSHNQQPVSAQQSTLINKDPMSPVDQKTGGSTREVTNRNQPTSSTPMKPQEQANVPVISSEPPQARYQAVVHATVRDTQPNFTPSVRFATPSMESQRTPTPVNNVSSSNQPVPIAPVPLPAPIAPAPNAPPHSRYHGVIRATVRDTPPELKSPQIVKRSTESYQSDAPSVSPAVVSNVSVQADQQDPPQQIQKQPPHESGTSEVAPSKADPPLSTPTDSLQTATRNSFVRIEELKPEERNQIDDRVGSMWFDINEKCFLDALERIKSLDGSVPEHVVLQVNRGDDNRLTKTEKDLRKSLSIQLDKNDNGSCRLARFKLKGLKPESSPVSFHDFTPYVGGYAPIYNPSKHVIDGTRSEWKECYCKTGQTASVLSNLKYVSILVPKR